MAHAGVDHLRSAGGGPVAQAVVVGAQERAALDDLARHPELRLPRVVTACRAAWVAVAGVGVPVGGPLPDVARHVEQAVAVGREAADGRGAAVAGLGPPRELAVPVVGQPLTGLLGLVAPGVRRAGRGRRGRRSPIPPRSAAHRPAHCA